MDETDEPWNYGPKKRRPTSPLIPAFPFAQIITEIAYPRKKFV